MGENGKYAPLEVPSGVMIYEDFYELSG